MIEDKAKNSVKQACHLSEYESRTRFLRMNDKTKMSDAKMSKA